jgi:hypothetical protein
MNDHQQMQPGGPWPKFLNHLRLASALVAIGDVRVRRRITPAATPWFFSSGTFRVLAKVLP